MPSLAAVVFALESMYQPKLRVVVNTKELHVISIDTGASRKMGTWRNMEFFATIDKFSFSLFFGQQNLFLSPAAATQ